MKIAKFLTGLGLVVLASVSVGASAQTGDTVVSCVWTTSGGYVPGGSVSVKLCHDGGSASGPVVVTEETTYPGGQCVVRVNNSNYYVSTTNCGNETVYKKAPPPVCPNAGVVYPSIIRVGQGYPAFPTSTVQSFCGPTDRCAYKTETVANYPTASDLKVTCTTK